MKTMKCKACGKDISPKAKACPGCGHPNTPSTMDEIGRLFKVMAFVGVTLFFLIRCMGDREESEPYSPPVVARYSVSAAERVAIDEAKTKALVEQLKTVPEAMHHRNRDLYKQLVALAPNNAKYQERYEYYERKASADDLAAQSDVLIPRSMAGDKGKYFLLESKKTGNIVRAISKRIGVDTIGYTLTETNCETMLMREIGYSEVSASAIVSKPTKWFDLTPGSSKSDLANFVCKSFSPPITVASVPTTPKPNVMPSKTYTPAQLRQMVNSGKPPKQGSPTTQTQAISFDACVTKVNGVIDSIKAQYPAKILVKTKSLHMAKVWTNDGAMTFSCSQADGKLIITNAKYL